MTRILRMLCLVSVLVLVALPSLAGEPLFLWRVEGENATVHLTGSIHVGKPDFFPLPAPVEKAFADASALAVEVDITDQAVMMESAQLMMSRAVLPEGETLEDHVTPELWQRLVTFANERGLTVPMFATLRPGIAALLLTMNEYKRVGFDPELGIDKHFLQTARAQEKEIRQIEDVETQLELFLEISETLDDVLLEQMLDQMEEITDFTQQMIDLWLAGDADGLVAFMQEQMGEDAEMRDFYRRLLDDRNVAMVETIDGWLKADTDVFVVVGAGHYGGEMGILKLLADKGWEVTQVTD